MSAQTPQQESPKSKSRSISFRQILGLLVLAVFVVFLVENNHQVTVRLIVPEKQISLSLALLAAGVLGALGLLLIQHRRHRR